MNYNIFVVTCSNSQSILEKNLLASPDIVSGKLSIRILTGAKSASAAYAEVVLAAPAPILVFVHQDIFLPAGWKDRLLLEIAAVEHTDPNWAILGSYGARTDGRHFGYLYDTSTRRILGQPMRSPEEVCILDEIVIVLRVASGVNFDPQLPGFHLYATDIALTARAAGKSAWAANIPVVHNSSSIPTLDKQYGRAWSYVTRKWKHCAPYPNLMTKWMGSSDWPLFKWRLRNRLLLWRGKRKLFDRVDDPSHHASKLDIVT